MRKAYHDEIPYNFLYIPKKGFPNHDQYKIDNTMIELDGTENKSRLGANAMLGASMASIRAAAKLNNCPLYKYLSPNNNLIMPVPMMNILNGGSHADNTVDIQEFMDFPYGAKT